MSSIVCAQTAAQVRPRFSRCQAFAVQMSLLLAVAPGASAQPAEREVSLDALLAYAARHAPALAVVRAELAQADAARAGAEPLLRENPVLEVGVGPRIPTNSDDLGVDVIAELAQPIEIAGERGARLHAARKLGARLQAGADVAAVELRRTLALGYAEAAAARERAAFAEQLAHFARELATVAERRLAAGDANLIEVRVAQADAAAAGQERLEAEGALRAAQLLLCAESGWPVATPPLPRVRGADPTAPEVPQLTALVQQARARHPELRAQKAALALANAERDLAEREAWPEPSIGVSYVHEGTRPANDIVLGTIALPLPLFARNQGEHAKAVAAAGRARAESASISQQLEGRIGAAHAALQAAAARIALFGAQIGPRLDEGLALLERGFTAGEIPLLEVLAARERLLSSKRAALDAGADYARARAELDYALGAELPATEGTKP